MRSIDVTASDLRSRSLAPSSLATAVAALREDGIVALLGAVAPEHVRRLRERLADDRERVLARGAETPFNWNSGNLQQSPPRDPAWIFPDVLMNDQAAAVTSAVLGAGVINAFYSGNTALPRSRARQPVHVDTGHLFPVAAPAHAIVVNLLLVDTDAGNGATEIWPGSHLDATVAWNASIEVPLDVVERRRALAPPCQPRLPAGALVLRDMRLWHAGMPNPSDHARPMIAMIHWAGWWQGREQMPFPRAAEGLLEHPVLKTSARYVDEVDHTRLDHAYGYAVEVGASPA